MHSGYRPLRSVGFCLLGEASPGTRRKPSCGLPASDLRYFLQLHNGWLPVSVLAYLCVSDRSRRCQGQTGTKIPLCQQLSHSAAESPPPLAETLSLPLLAPAPAVLSSISRARTWGWGFRGPLGRRQQNVPTATHQGTLCRQEIRDRCLSVLQVLTDDDLGQDRGSVSPVGLSSG